VVIGVLALSVMFVLSARFGNIAAGNQEMIEANGLTAEDITDLSTYILLAFMLLPLATVGDMANIFEEDGRAGFAKVAAILPVSISKRVLAKYITIFSMFGIGVAADILISFILSILTDVISFENFLAIIISAASVICIYSALVTAFCIIFGQENDNYARLVAILVIVITVLASNISKIKLFFTDKNFNLFNHFITFIKEKSYILFILAMLVIILSYFISVFAAERKRGVV
jgi:hypothetical protein